MPPKKEQGKDDVTPRRQPATTPEEREKQMIGYADELAERQLREGTASSQVITHYLKLGTSREGLEQEKIRNENLRLKAQIAALESQQRAEDMMAQLLGQMRLYMGVDEDDEDPNL